MLFLIVQFLDITENSEMLIRILHFFLNRSISIIMDCCYKNLEDSNVVKDLTKNSVKFIRKETIELIF